MTGKFDSYTDEQIIAAYIKARNEKAALKKEHEKALERYDDAMTMFERVMLARLSSRGANNSKTPSGTAYKKLATTATVTDRDKWLNYVIEHHAWSLVTNHVSKDAVGEVIEVSGSPPPGVTCEQIVKVQFLKG